MGAGPLRARMRAWGVGSTEAGEMVAVVVGLGSSLTSWVGWDCGREGWPEDNCCSGSEVSTGARSEFGAMRAASCWARPGGRAASRLTRRACRGEMGGGVSKGV